MFKFQLSCCLSRSSLKDILYSNGYGHGKWQCRLPALLHNLDSLTTMSFPPSSTWYILSQLMNAFYPTVIPTGTQVYQVASQCLKVRILPSCTICNAFVRGMIDNWCEFIYVWLSNACLFCFLCWYKTAFLLRFMHWLCCSDMGKGWFHYYLSLCQFKLDLVFYVKGFAVIDQMLPACPASWYIRCIELGEVQQSPVYSDHMDKFSDNLVNLGDCIYFSPKHQHANELFNLFE